MSNILVVDDDPDFLVTVQTVLEIQGHSVRTAAEGREALDAMRRNKPELVVLDVMMSYMLDGIDVAEAMSQDADLRDIPILMVSSLAGRDADVLVADRNLTIDDWISKPVTPNDLLRRVARLLQ